MQIRLARWLSAAVIFAILTAAVLAHTNGEDRRTRRGAPPRRLKVVVVTAAQVSTVRRAGPGLSLGHSPVLGLYLADASGRALYMVESDVEGTSTCYGRCPVIWPPVLVTAAPVAVDSLVDAERIGTVRRRDDMHQATYNRHPLYYYLGDSASGTTRGHHVEDSWGEWYLIEPNGTRAAVGGPRTRDVGLLAVR